jgi:voltage-gated potassium channel
MAEPSKSQPRSDSTPFVVRWERKSRFWIVVAALVPLVPSGPTYPRSLQLAVGIACWLVFVADFAVHLRHVPRFLRTGWGIFDLVLVIGTFPYGVVLGLQHGGVTSVLRLLRLLRVIAAGANARQLISRTNKLALYVVLVLSIGSLIIYQVESGTAGFDNLGDAVWFSIVTMTTVGYGDLVPQTAAGQVTASVLMVFGIGLIGAVAGILTSYLGLSETESPPPTGDESRSDGERTADELRAARAELEASAAKVAALLGGTPDSGER